MNILVVEDEPVLREGLLDLLQGAGHTTDWAADGLSAVSTGSNGTFDLVLLDLMLPKLDGVSVCQRLRKVHPNLPILMLTASGAEDDKILGLKVGADDYVTKPFSPRELLARIEAIGRRTRLAPSEPDQIEGDDCHFDFGRCTACRGEHLISLTPREVNLLRWLHRHRARAVSRAELLEHVWGARPDMETRTVDMTIANLRQKIERNAAEPRIIVAVKGVGYTWGAR